MDLQELQKLPITNKEKHLFHIAICDFSESKTGKQIENWNPYKHTPRELQMIMLHNTAQRGIKLVMKKTIKGKSIQVVDIEKTFADEENKEVLVMIHNPNKIK